MGRELRCPGRRATVPTGREPRCPGQRAMVPMGRQPQCPWAELQGPSGHTPGALCSASPARPLRQTAAPAPLPHSEDMRVDMNKTGRASGLICTDQAPSGQGCGLWAIRLSNLGGGQRALQHPVFSLHQMESSSTCCPHTPLPCGACGPHAPWTLALVSLWSFALDSARSPTCPLRPSLTSLGSPLGWLWKLQEARSWHF